jgi:hypothetical protein
MRKLFMGLAILPFLTVGASASELLSNQQMDGVTAGFDAISIADAEGLVGGNSSVLTTTATLAQVNPFAKVSVGETSFTIYKSLAASTSSTVTSSLPVVPLGLSSP